MNTRRILVGMVFTAAMSAASAGCAGPGAGTAPTPEPANPVGSPAAAAATIAPELVGSWTTSITADDLKAGGITDVGGINENTGTFTMTFGADGTWSTSQESDIPVRWPVFRGTMSSTGPDSFRQVTTFPSDFAGDEVDFTWSVEDGALELTVVDPPDPVLPIVMESHPWQPKG